MSDTTLNRFVALGTDAERLAFTPSPPTPASGPDNLYIWFTTDTLVFYAWDGSGWVALSTGAGFANPMTTLGDFISAGSGGTPIRVGIGDEDDVMTVVAGVPAWAPPVPVVGTINAQSGTTYTLDILDGQNTVTLSNGSGCVVTIPTNAAEAFPINTQIAVVALTAGIVQVVPDGGVTLIARDSFDKLAGNGSIAVLLKVATNTWVFNGDTAA